MAVTNVLLTVSWLAVVSSAWSTSINGLFGSRGAKASSMGGPLVETVASGAQLAMEHCQDRFKWALWNCPESAFSRRVREATTRESAYVSAITAAGVMHAVIRNCSKGQLEGCGCRRVPHATATATVDSTRSTDGGDGVEGWTWDDCTEHLDYGERVSETVLDELERGSDTRAFANLHNNAAGRAAVKTTMQKRCRCHGVSGSCSLQTCWSQPAPFHEVSAALMIRYEAAVRLDYETGEDRLAVGNSASSEVLQVPPGNLVYVADSPDYCLPDSDRGWNGTIGRACSRAKGEGVSQEERRSCKNLCRSCGHRVRKERRKITKRCRCEFRWCCEVHCDTCTETLDQFYCE